MNEALPSVPTVPAPSDGFSAAPFLDSPPSPGDSRPPPVADHQLLRRVGVGAYGEVWLAKNILGALRAVKIVRRDAHPSAESFEREFKGLQKFEPVSRSHEGFVDILSVGMLPDTSGFYYIMELADDAQAHRDDTARGARLLPSRNGPGHDKGRLNLAPPSRHAPAGSLSAPRTPDLASYTPRTLRADLKYRGALPAEEVIALGLELAAALAHLHDCGLVHRDVKPSNILIIGGQPKLADAGLVANLDDARSLVGTAGYIAPEGPGTPQADLYALGKVLYEAAFGKDRQEFPSLPADVAARPDHALLLELNTIILKACATDCRQRYRSADAMRSDLEMPGTGRSIKCRHAWQQRVDASKKVILAISVLVLLAASEIILRQGNRRPAMRGDGAPSKVSDANALCEKAMLIMRGDNYEAFPEAYANFNRAIELDPKFARAYAGLLELRLRESVPGMGPMERPELLGIAGKLQELAPNMAAAHCAQSALSFRDFDFLRATESALTAIKADPNYELAHTHYGFVLLALGRPSEAREQFEISRSLNAAKGTIYCGLGHAFFARRDYANALVQYRKATEFDRRHAFAYQCIAETYRALADYGNSIDYSERAAALRGEDGSKAFYDELRQAVNARGARGYWEAWWNRSESDPCHERYWKAVYQLKLGNTNAALSMLIESSQIRQQADGADREPNLVWLLFHEFWDDLRDHPRFKETLDRAGFSKVIPGAN